MSILQRHCNILNNPKYIIQLTKTQALLLHIDDVTHNKHGTRGLLIIPEIQMLFNNKELPKIAANYVTCLGTTAIGVFLLVKRLRDRLLFNVSLPSRASKFISFFYYRPTFIVVWMFLYRE